MQENTYTLSKTNLKEAMEWLTAALSQKGMEPKEIFTTRLLVEESLLQLERLAAEREDFSVHVALRKWLGDINVELSAKGEPYRPLANFSKLAIDAKEYAGMAILHAHRKKLKYARRNGRNIVIIKAHESTAKRTRRAFAGLVLGIAFGIFLKEIVADPAALEWIDYRILDPIQIMFLHALIMVTAPMIFFSVLAGISNITDTASLERIGEKLILYSLPKLAFYVAMGLFVGHVLGSIDLNLAHISKEDSAPISGVSIRDLIINIIPGDIVMPFYTNNILQMLFLAAFFGVLLSRAGTWADWARDGISFFHRFFSEVVDIVTLFIPVLVMVSMMKLMIHTGIGALLPFGKLLLATALGVPLTMLISSALVFFLGRISPLPFARKLAAFLPLPFSLSDSTACMPATLSFCSKALGMEQKFTRFAIPVGMQLNMDGTACYVAIVSMMLVQTYGVEMGMEFGVSFFLTQFLISLTGIGLLAMPSVYASYGIPGIATAMVIGIEPLLDMFGTAQSVAGNITSSFLVCRREGQVDEAVYLGKGNGD